MLRRSVTEAHFFTDYAWGWGQYYGQASVMGVPSRRLCLNVKPCISVTSLSRVDGTLSWDVSQLHVSSGGIVDALFGNPISGHITITYTAGYTSIPAEFALATRIIVQHLWQTQRGNKGWT